MTIKTRKNNPTILPAYCFYNLTDSISRCSGLNPAGCNVTICIDKPLLNNEATFLLGSSGALTGAGTFSRQKPGGRIRGGGRRPFTLKTFYLNALHFHLNFN
jgi:hypothetical protein